MKLLIAAAIVLAFALPAAAQEAALPPNDAPALDRDAFCQGYRTGLDGMVANWQRYRALNASVDRLQITLDQIEGIVLKAPAQVQVSGETVDCTPSGQ